MGKAWVRRRRLITGRFWLYMIGDILIRVVNNRPLNKGYSGVQRVQISGLSSVRALGFPERFAEEIKRFWHGEGEVLFLENKEGANNYQVVVERISERRSLAVFGAGHVGCSVALMGVMLGLEVMLIDDRMEFLRKERMPVHGVQLVPGDFNLIGNSIVLSRRSAVVIVTRGHQYDEVILKQMVDHEIGYIGMIGSKRRIEGVFRRLRREGVSESFLKSVKAPIGLDIGAVSPQEIAVSVHAEIIKHFSYNRV